MNDAMALARWACETMMGRFAPQDLPPKGHFHYHQGVFLWGMLQVWQLDGNKELLDYARGWLDAVLGPDVTPRDFVPGELDDIQPGNLLFPVWEATGDPRYRRAMDAVYAQYARIPRCACGGYCHKPDLPGQMWLDGLYMGGPFLARYAALTGQPVLWQQVAEQIFLMARNTRDDATGLWRHAWDETLRAPWADPGTGCSPEFWGRSLGWVPLALLDDLDAMPAGFAPREQILALLQSLLHSLCRYQGEDGRWYQVVDKAGATGNWPENSCTCLFAAALYKAVRLGYLPSSLLPTAGRGYDGVVRSLTEQNGELCLSQVCIGTGVGDYRYYCGRPVSTNDLHGMGAFLLMCTERERLRRAR